MDPLRRSGEPSDVHVPTKSTEVFSFVRPSPRGRRRRALECEDTARAAPHGARAAPHGARKWDGQEARGSGRGRRLKRVEGHLPAHRTGAAAIGAQIHAVSERERERARGGEECNERGRSWKARDERERSAL